MLRTLDILLIVIMTAVATITYTIKHRAEEKLEEVRKLEANIRLEKDTIDLLRADWALLTQPARLEKLIALYQEELKLQPTDTTQMVQPVELPMLKADLPPVEEADAKDDKKTGDKAASASKSKTDDIKTGSVAR
ncbi:hypothetical protein M2360_004620 [Rhizobium sp. SG_E_25_P2]|jgi:hypothetical protein|uniref:cell division protein FtsL n=1 Tax=Rhizobium sp. SG_E_25_P2 TaxID=2879942 RepID=UPI0024768EC9|nr:hypothetical protein [Rhizobium sp. SG_E_25_P2]MDH6269193.1 hypothetical protein [Rhizobium sp. SG_E_25_P2]